MAESFDRAAVRAMVEDNFRAVTIAQLQGQQQLGHDITDRFFDRIEAMQALMPAAQGETFGEMVNEETHLLVEEWKRDRKGISRRLGIPLFRAPAAGYRPPARYRRQGLGELAVRTAVRATIWETIFRLFRR
jgi:hypothetical protein